MKSLIKTRLDYKILLNLRPSNPIFVIRVDKYAMMKAYRICENC